MDFGNAGPPFVGSQLGFYFRISQNRLLSGCYGVKGRSRTPHDVDHHLPPFRTGTGSSFTKMADSTLNTPMRWTVVNDQLSFDWPSVCRWFYARSLYRHSERVFLACLGRAASKVDGLCAVSIAQLADECGVPSDQARRAFAELTALGLLSVLSGPDPSDHQLDNFQLLLEVRLPMNPTDVPPSKARPGALATSA